MNRKMFIPACLSFLTLGLAACNVDPSPTNNPDPSVPTHTHNWESAWKHDDANHWHACQDSSCNEVNGKVAHSGGTATCLEKAKCEVCGVEYGELASHTYPETWTCTAVGHYKTCTVEGCGVKTELVSHKGGTATCQKQAVCEVCEKPYGDLASTHVFDEEIYVKFAEGHAHPCKEEGCDAHSTLENHEPGAAATETEAQKCVL